MNYGFDFGALTPYWPALCRGILSTIWLTVAIIVIGTPLGVLFGLALRSRLKLLRFLTYLIVDVVRAVPALVLIFIAYYFIPVLPGLHRVSSTIVACAALSIYLAAFQADVIRGGIAAVPSSYIEAGRALGMNRWTIIRRIELPFVMKTTLPTTAVLWIGMLKNSSLASLIGVVELTHTASTISSNTFRSVEVYLLVGAAYVVVVMPFSMLARKVESAALRYNTLSS